MKNISSLPFFIMLFYNTLVGLQIVKMDYLYLSAIGFSYFVIFQFLFFEMCLQTKDGLIDKIGESLNKTAIYGYPSAVVVIISYYLVLHLSLVDCSGLHIFLKYVILGSLPFYILTSMMVLMIPDKD